MDPARSARDGLAALRAGRHAEAEQLLAAAFDDRDLASDPDLRDIHARIGSLLAQARLALGDFSGARLAAESSLAQARAAGDDAGVEAVLALRLEITDAANRAAPSPRAQREERRIAATPLPELERGTDPGARIDARLRKCAACNAVGDGKQALSLAEEALQLALAAGLLKEEVLSRLALAEVARERATEQLHAAWHRADDADDANLVTAIARLAERLGVVLRGEA